MKNDATGNLKPYSRNGAPPVVDNSSWDMERHFRQTACGEVNRRRRRALLATKHQQSKGQQHRWMSYDVSCRMVRGHGHGGMNNYVAGELERNARGSWQAQARRSDAVTSRSDESDQCLLPCPSHRYLSCASNACAPKAGLLLLQLVSLSKLSYTLKSPPPLTAVGMLGLADSSFTSGNDLYIQLICIPMFDPLISRFTRTSRYASLLHLPDNEAIHANMKSAVRNPITPAAPLPRRLDVTINQGRCAYVLGRSPTRLRAEYRVGTPSLRSRHIYFKQFEARPKFTHSFPFRAACPDASAWIIQCCLGNCVRASRWMAIDCLFFGSREERAEPIYNHRLNRAATMLSSIHRNPTARVYTLRCLLGTTLPVIVLSVHYVNIPGVVCGIMIWIHHILVIFHWTLRGLALIDLAAVLIEIGAWAYVTVNMGLLFSIPPLAFLLFSLLFRITTIVKTNERLLIQRKTTIHSDVHPPQPIARKAIGEFSNLILRAIVVTCIGLGVPAFGIYATIIKPSNTVVSTTLISNPSFEEDLPGNATITFAPDDYHYESTAWEVSVTAMGRDHSGIDCPIDGPNILSTAICSRTGQIGGTLIAVRHPGPCHVGVPL
ncbi:hypothetical protein K438DRAFT_1777441 [Mycena galopus ATCC 62051]|nr:hypothetical protein K438DRAFT_1777441 [Mycena galopus ATCC 62051]